MRVELHPGFVIHRRPYRETSLVLEVFSSRQGRVGVVAKGAQRPRSPWRGALQPFQCLLIAWSGRGELGTLTHAEQAGFQQPLSGGRILSGFYVNELLTRLLTRGDPHPRLYEAYAEALTALAGPTADEPVLRIFEKRLLAEIGYGLVLDRDNDGEAAIEDGRDYYYQIDKGPWRVAPADVATLKIGGGALIALAREALTGREHLRETKALMRFVLSAYLGGRPLASRELFRAASGGAST
ncbi:MAG: DNA repair protein RecO [Gammaproteobacteria bacterium]